jgi:predicted glycosyltransferase
MSPTVLFYCQHSVGIGHLTRSFAIAAAMARRFKVVFLNGGPLPAGVLVPPGMQIIDLPPLGMVGGHELISRDGQVDVAEARRRRREWILEALHTVQPDLLFIELFPFGRKKFAFELLPLLKAAKAMARRRGGAPRIVSSLRDILVAARPDQQRHDDRAAWICRRWFDAVLVHADPRLARLEDTFRPRRPLATPVHYTGFVVPERSRGARPRPAPAVPSILVSAGGGIVGAPLFAAALAAHAALPRASRPRLDLVAGPFLPEADWLALRAAVAGRDDVVLQRVVPDLAARMRAASVSLSQCGYNTAMDIVMAGVPALVVPYAEGREDEQTNRARRMAALGLLRMLEPADLGPATLAAALQDTLAFEPRPNGLDVDGAERTVEILAGLLVAPEAAAPLRQIA